MCGFVGGTLRTILDDKRLDRALESLHHRGPDKIHLPNFILTFLSDRMEMAHSIEGRVPFLDHKVAEFCAGVPIAMKIKGMREKHVLREAAKDVILNDVYNREKRPFATPPAKAGVKDALLEMYGDVINYSARDNQPISNPEPIRQIYKAFPTFGLVEAQRFDAFFNRIVSMTLMNERFGMKG